MYYGKKGGMMSLPENSTTEHIRPKLMRRKLQRPILKRRKKSEIISGKSEKERKSGTKKKENINININNNINKLNSFSSYVHSSSTHSLERKNLPVFSDTRNTGEEKQDKPLSSKQKRVRLKNQDDYYHKKKFVSGKEPQITQKMELILKIWDNLAEQNNGLQTILDKKRTTKKFKQTCTVVRAFLNGTLLTNKLVIIPKYNKTKNLTKQNPLFFETYVHRLDLQMNDPDYKRLKFKGVDLLTFLAGQQYTGYPSVLLRYCMEEPERQIEYIWEDYFEEMEKEWRNISDKEEFNSTDYKNFDKYLEWGLRHFYQLKKNLTSLGDYIDEMEVLCFITFGTLRQFKNKGNSFNTGILNQEFFKTMMEDFRKFHRYTV